MPTLYGMPIDIGHTDDSYSTLYPMIGRDTAASLVLALDDQVLSGTLTVTEGHHHRDTAAKGLSWLQVGSYRTADATVRNDELKITGMHIDHKDPAKVACIVPLVIPDGSTTVTPAVRVIVPNPAHLTVTFDYDPPATIGSGTIAGGSITIPHTETDSWHAGAATSLAAVGLTDGYLIAYLRVTVEVTVGGSSSAYLLEVQVGI
jgi:hypothetical protein